PGLGPPGVHRRRPRRRARGRGGGGGGGAGSQGALCRGHRGGPGADRARRRRGPGAGIRGGGDGGAAVDRAGHAGRPGQRAGHRRGRGRLPGLRRRACLGAAHRGPGRVPGPGPGRGGRAGGGRAWCGRACYGRARPGPSRPGRGAPGRHRPGRRLGRDGRQHGCPVNGELMAAEMAEQPDVLARVTARAPADTEAVRAVLPGPLAGVVFLARGSSDNAAVFGRDLAELRAGRPAGLAAPSLYTRYHATVDWRGYLGVALSQSGATPEIISTCRAMRAGGAVVLGITNEPGSPLAGTVDLLLSTDAGPERAVPATKTVTAQLAVLVTVTAALHTGAGAGDPGAGGAQGSGTLDGLPGAVAAVLGDPRPVERLAG